MYSLVIFVLVSAIYSAFAQTIRTTFICPEGFKAIGRKCYYFSNQPVMWTDSHFSCEILNSTLLVFSSPKEQNLLKGFIIQDNNMTVDPLERWIDGIYDWQQQKWKWGSTGKFIDSSFTKRSKGNKYKWSCIALNGQQDNKWVARKCTEKLPFICETESNVFVEFKLYKRKKKFNITKCSSGDVLEEYQRKRCIKMLGRTNEAPGELNMHHPKKPALKKRTFDGWVCPPHMVSLANRCYFFSTSESTWTDAHFECRKNGTKLAIIRTKGQDHNLRMFLNNFIEKHDRWIGAMYDWKTEKWRWAMTGQPLSYKGFNSTVFKAKPPMELAWNSIFMDPRLDNQWNSAKQTEKKRFICQVMAKAVKRLGRKRRKLPPQATITILNKRQLPANHNSLS